MINAILEVLSFCLFILIVAILYSRIADGEWFWQTRKKKKKMEEEFEEWKKEELIKDPGE